MNARNRKVTNGNWGVSTTRATGTPGIELSVYIYRPGRLFADGKDRFQKGDWDGARFADHDQSDALTLERGYSQRYGRNTMRFVMSRAARKRGMTTDDRSYNDPYKRKCSVG